MSGAANFFILSSIIIIILDSYFNFQKKGEN